MTETAAIITALGGFIIGLIGALVMLAKLLVEVRTVKTSTQQAAAATATLTPNGGSTIHDSIRRTEATSRQTAAEVVLIRRDLDKLRTEDDRLWSAINHPSRRTRRFWRKP